MKAPAMIWAVVSLGLFFSAHAEERRPAAVKDAAKWGELQGGEPVLLTEEGEAAEGETKRVLAGIIIDAPVEAVWGVVCDKEAAPDYMKNMKSAKIVEKGRDGDGIEFHLVKQEMKIGLLPGTFVYTCKHRLQAYDRIDFKRTSGDLKDIEGYWKFLPVDGGAKTLLVYQLHLDPGMLIPGPIIRGSLKKNLPDALRAIGDLAVLKRSGE